MGSLFSSKSSKPNDDNIINVKLADSTGDSGKADPILSVPQQPQTRQISDTALASNIDADKNDNEDDVKQNINCLDLYKPDRYIAEPGFNNKILLYGFMRDIEKELSGQYAMQIIPDTIMRLCDAYYSTPNIIFYFEIDTANNGNSLYIVDLDDMDRKLTKKHTFLYNNILSTMQPNAIQNAGMYYKSKIKLPLNIINKLPDDMKENIDTNSKRNTCFDIIFKCGGTLSVGGNTASTYCCAYIWKSDDKYFDKIYELKLPEYPVQESIGQSLTWSDKQQCLYSIATHNVYGLSLSDWKWKTYNNLNKFGSIRKGFMSTVIVNNDINEERLICVGGGDPWKNNKGVKYCDLYEIERNKWIKIADMNFERHRTGIYHDKWTQRIFIGGGNGAERKIEFYDLNKNKWYFNKNNIPYTTMKHNVYPIIWNQDGHLLYIASIKANGVEFIDLRLENQKWTLVHNHLDPLFGTNIVWYNAANCRLIQ